MEPVTRDVVIVGGGIGGSGLAAVLADGGLDVEVLERTTTFPDRVRGEIAHHSLVLGFERQPQQRGEERIGVVCCAGEHSSELCAELEADAPMHVRDRGTVLVKLGDLHRGASEWERYLTRYPQARDAAAFKEELRRIRQTLAERN